MDCLQLQLQPHQLRTQPFHYFINEQAKSLLALQELQNEVGALLEFRDLVMETFPNLRQKMSTSAVSHNTFSNTQNYCSNLPLPLSGSLNSRHWEPGIKVKRKIIHKSDNENSFVRVRSNSQSSGSNNSSSSSSSKLQSSQPKSSEAISGVQDSGFSTETNSSNKDHVSSTATFVPHPVQPDDSSFTAATRKESTSPRSHKVSRTTEYDRSDEELSEDGLVVKVNEAEEELWNLLDVIHTKGTKLREEVETLQLRLMVEEIENHLKSRESEMKKVGKKLNRRCRSLDNVDEEGVGVGGGNSLIYHHATEMENFHPNFKLQEISYEEDVFNKKRTRRSIDFEDIDHIRQERNMLLEKLAEMETENVANRMKTSELQNEISALIRTKEELQEQLFQAVKQKTELNGKIHELHMKFVTGDRKWKNGGGSGKTSTTSTTTTTTNSDRIPAKEELTDLESSQTLKSSDSSPRSRALDGIVSDPKELKKCIKLTDGNKKKLAAILKERNYLELQRHLLVSVVHNQNDLNVVITVIDTHVRVRVHFIKSKKKFKV
ncbi:conserved hypothetical protein [Pediculus humanus corporis]|uniref:Uncharacterized protein n=1 Tax=Pediculus humanus subsp. corporis TaxID=121224 RepID=E0W178_PEDHC|nr:uncharacterized protein Phum_PHUM570160 [Pediculus humanus corporis]EEB19384.1 conserved hypothetical protein [Pediculus humanus corporis]